MPGVINKKEVTSNIAIFVITFLFYKFSLENMSNISV